MPDIKELFFTFIRNYGGTAIFFSLLLEYVGLPIPGESLMLMLGFTSVGKGTVTSLILATAGTFTGSMAAYTIGYRYGENIILKIGKPLHLTKEKLDKVELLRRHEALYIIFCRFIPGARHVVPYLSGIRRVDVYRNSLYNLVSGAIWCSTFIYLGNLAGSKWESIGKFVGTYTLMALVLFVFIFIVLKYFNKFKIPVFSFSVFLIALILFTSELMENELSPFDNQIYGYLSKLITEDMTDVIKLISDMGSVYVLGAVAAVLLTVFWIKRKYWFYGKMVTVNLISISLLNILFKTVFHRARPDILQLVHAGGYSFPSGHSMISVSFYGYLIYLCIVYFKQPWKQIISVALSLLVLTIGISRIYLGVHYASDVIGGFLVGFSWLVIFISLTKSYAQKYTLNAESP
jgi:undecaprenyl-diphosphatase